MLQVDSTVEVITAIRTRIKYYEQWRWILWTIHLWLVALSGIASVCVPFGLAALLYVPAESRDRITIITLILSCCSLVFYIIDHLWRLPDRSATLKRCAAILTTAFLRHQGGIVSLEELISVFQAVSDEHARADGV